ncbi:MAG: dihydropteroate synthase [Gammaproteobacteria bacterium]|nr:dihydropteroate synthase [Gammaproteobacteria bacterium]
MVVLGLGSNLGDRLATLRLALRALEKIANFRIEQVSPVYLSDALLPEDGSSSWDLPYLNLAIRCETSLTPYELLQHTKDIEIALGRVPGKDWAPRPVDIDILAWDDLVQFDDKLHVPHEHLHSRPFALWPLADVAPRWIYPLKNAFYGKTATEIASPWGSRFTGDAPLHTKQIAQRIDTPQLVGILNITLDSFSDGGLFSDVDAAITHAHGMVNAGAEIIDIGAEATGPKAKPLDAATEWLRLEPVLAAILAESTAMLITPKISVDTYHAEVAKKALAFGVDWINDVSGLSDPAMVEVVAETNHDIVIMHQLSLPVDTKKVLPATADPVAILSAWAEKKLVVLEKAGIKRERLIVDVGLGFGKTAEQSLELIQRIDSFKFLDTRLLIGHSRKSFLQLFTDRAVTERDIETLAISLFLASHQIDYLRIHNVDICARGLKVAKALNP